MMLQYWCQNSDYGSSSGGYIHVAGEYFQKLATDPVPLTKSAAKWGGELVSISFGDD